MTRGEQGALVARLLRGAWRHEPPPPALSEAELAAITPALLGAGAGALAWRVVQGTFAAPALEEASRLHRLQAALHDRTLAEVLDIADEHAAAPLLVKGWTVARRYPLRGLRPYGDVDLLAPDGQRDALAAEYVARLPGCVDLEHAFLTADGTPLDVLFARARTAAFQGRDVHVLGAEDDIRLLCLHYMRSGGWRALSLCDVALVLEAAPDDLDWALVLPEDRRVRSWVVAAAGLARELLGADLSRTPLAMASAPGWVVHHVLEGFGGLPLDRRTSPAFTRAGPAGMLRQVADRWPPDPLEVTLYQRRPLRSRPPVHLQAYDVAARAVAAVAPGAVSATQRRPRGARGS